MARRAMETRGEGAVSAMACGQGPCGKGGAEQRGSGSVAGLTVMLVIAVMLCAVAVVGGTMVSKSVVRTAADQAALAAAYRRSGGADAVASCAEARTVAARHAARLDACSFEGEDVTVAVSRGILAAGSPASPGTSIGPSGGGFRTRAVSRAGPIDCP